MVQEWIGDAQCSVEVLEPDGARGNTLIAMQVTTRSALGAIIYESGGLLVDSGWLWILGSGHPRLPRSVASWNFQCGMEESPSAPPPCVLIADDAVGGFYALNGGRFAPSGHDVWYFSPACPEWECLGIGYSEFIRWSMSGELARFHEAERWPGWQADVASLQPDHAFDRLTEASSRLEHPIAELFERYIGRL